MGRTRETTGLGTNIDPPRYGGEINTNNDEYWLSIHHKPVILQTWSRGSSIQHYWLGQKLLQPHCPSSLSHSLCCSAFPHSQVRQPQSSCFSVIATVKRMARVNSRFILSAESIKTKPRSALVSDQAIHFGCCPTYFVVCASLAAPVSPFAHLL